MSPLRFLRRDVSVRRKSSFVPSVDGLEGRLVLSSAHAVASTVHSAVVSIKATINQQIVNFLSKNVGKRLGGGECAHLATEALRVAGAKFVSIGADSPGSGDYDWGTLIKTYEVKSGKLTITGSTSIQPGDVLQYRNATFSTGSKATHHTAVVAAVDSSGRVTKVYQQNIGNGGQKGVNRTVTLSTLDLNKLNGGWVRIYRPESRVNQSGRYEFSLVNNASTSQTVKLFGKNYSFTAANTTDSYKTFWATGSRPTLTLNNKTYSLDNGAGYEIVGSGSSITLRKLSA